MTEKKQKPRLTLKSLESRLHDLGFKLSSELENLSKEIASIKITPGPKGDPGVRGPDGDVSGLDERLIKVEDKLDELESKSKGERGKLAYLKERVETNKEDARNWRDFDRDNAKRSNKLSLRRDKWLFGLIIVQMIAIGWLFVEVLS